MLENNKIKEDKVAYEDNLEQPSQPNSLGKSQKIAVAVLAFFTLVIFIFWGIQFKKNLSEPFAYKGSKEAEAPTGSSVSEDSEEALQSKDTDKDGLNDWDELYFYKTSPYLEDSDSDGFSDKEEVDNNKDPNCPAGRDCYASGIVDGDKAVIDDGLGEQQGTDSFNALLEQFGYDEAAPSETVLNTIDLESLLGSELNATTLRPLLLQYDMDKEVLDQISDEQLIESFKEVTGGN